MLVRLDGHRMLVLIAGCETPVLVEDHEATTLLTESHTLVQQSTANYQAIVVIVGSSRCCRAVVPRLLLSGLLVIGPSCYRWAIVSPNTLRILQIVTSL